MTLVVVSSAIMNSLGTVAAAIFLCVVIMETCVNSCELSPEMQVCRCFVLTNANRILNLKLLN